MPSYPFASRTLAIAPLLAFAFAFGCQAPQPILIGYPSNWSPARAEDHLKRFVLPPPPMLRPDLVVRDVWWVPKTNVTPKPRIRVLIANQGTWASAITELGVFVWDRPATLFDDDDSILATATVTVPALDIPTIQPHHCWIVDLNIEDFNLDVARRDRMEALLREGRLFANAVVSYAEPNNPDDLPWVGPEVERENNWYRGWVWRLGVGL